MDAKVRCIRTTQGLATKVTTGEPPWVTYFVEGLWPYAAHCPGPLPEAVAARTVLCHESSVAGIRRPMFLLAVGSLCFLTGPRLLLAVGIKSIAAVCAVFVSLRCIRELMLHSATFVSLCCILVLFFL